MKSATRSNIVSALEQIAAQRRVPCATYRLQLNRLFTFRDARGLVPYLRELGITDCHASPIFKTCRAGSHGYDVCDHSQLNPELGSDQDFEAFAASLRSKDMGLILDTVPNHMGIGSANNWWSDVLENGLSSIYASYFDIDWQPVAPELQNKVLLPILEDQYGRVLEGGRLRLAYENGAFFVYYGETRLPVSPRSYSAILSHRLAPLCETLGQEHENVAELQSILTALSYLPPQTEVDPDKIVERNREKEIIKRRIAALCDADPNVRLAIEDAVEIFNGTPGEPRTFDLLDTLMDSQAYRPAYWRVAAEEVNYRRFFDINELAALRVEHPDVFRATHELVFRLLAEGKVTGLRIDHLDGLWDPPAYLRQLQENYFLERTRGRLEAASPKDLKDIVAAWLQAPRSPASSPLWALYVVAEKILSQGELLPREWALCGTTGYDFLNALNGLFVDGTASRKLTRTYRDFTGLQSNFPNLVNGTKKMTMLMSLPGEINALSHQLVRIAKQNRWCRDFTLNSLTFALREIIAALAVYRTYISGPDSAQRDVEYIETAVAEAKRRNPRTAEAIFDFLRDALLLRNLEDFREEDRKRLIGFVMEFQQITVPVMAKGVEDTAFYIYNRLVSLNEVGGNPGDFGVSVAAFHQQNVERLRLWPHSMLTTSTHDTKRSGDVRARISVLSEMPQEWRAALRRWSRLNASKKTLVEGAPAPDRNDEYLLYQTLLGAWPPQLLSAEERCDFRTRIAAYMLKATKEAKVHTSWVNANEEYDAAVQNFVSRLLAGDSEDRPGSVPTGVGMRRDFLADFLPFQRRVAYYGQFNALSQVLLKLASPGVPETYQGNELWDFSLVDPDNRRPVDYQLRRALLADLRKRVNRSGGELSGLAKELLDTGPDGRIKLYLTYRTLNFRRAHAELFSNGAYLPLEATGEKRDHVCAFARTSGEEMIIVAVPRLVLHLTGGAEQPPLGEAAWRDTWLTLPVGEGRGYRNLFTGEVLGIQEYAGRPGFSLGTIFADFPAALLERIAGR
ncbi:MAG: malto-oligosyltrehalose synthase [Chloroflexi bacterium]|nr:malto-oligosyltrehalose synthase [Chloroflexota bacterium]